MWKLKSTTKEHVEHFCFVGEECVVGRKDSSLLIANDPSVSRRHAVLYVQHSLENLNNPSRKSSLFLRDEGSKYGTFKNGKRIASEEELVDGDLVKFGQFESEYKVYNVPLVVTTSCLDVSFKTKLRKIILKLGGHILSEWQPCCSHLVMSQVKVTIKALCCLISCKPIVLPQYFEDLEKSLVSSSAILSPSKYIPPTGESLIDKDKVSFDVNPARKNIFDGKTFFFMNEKQFKKLHLGIDLGGGNATILVDDTLDLTVLLREGSCFVEPIKDQIVTEDAKSLLRNIITILQEKELRMIPESDIGLAVAYCSTEKFCNPNFNLGAAVLGSQTIQSQTLSEREVYVPDTEEKIKAKHTSTVACEPSPKKRRIENESSLNLSSFRDENAAVFEIPLSSKIKKELDDLFDENGIQNAAKPNDMHLASTLQIDSELEIKESQKVVHTVSPVKQDSCLKIEDEQNSPDKNKSNSKTLIANSKASRIKDQEEFNFPMFQSPDRKRSSPKAIKETPPKGNMIGENSLNSAVKSLAVQEETLLPCNLMKIQFVDLICKKTVVPQPKSFRNSSVKNFKKFKKVYSLRAQALPRIIGIHELVAYDRDAVKMCKDNWDNPPEVTEDQPVKGEFDWDTPYG